VSIIYKASNLSFSYEEEKSVFSNLELSISRDEITVITGENGSGKTTLCRLLAGLNRGYCGSLQLSNREMISLKAEEIHREAIFIKQDTIGNIIGINLDEDLEIWQNRFQEKDNDQKREARRNGLKTLGISEIGEIPYWNLSVGQKRAGMLSALPLMSTSFWVLDEPTASLDKTRLEKLIALLVAKKKNGCGSLVMTHHPQVFSEIADQIFRLHDGKVLDAGH